MGPDDPIKIGGPRVRTLSFEERIAEETEKLRVSQERAAEAWKAAQAVPSFLAKSPDPMEQYMTGPATVVLDQKWLTGERKLNAAASPLTGLPIVDADRKRMAIWTYLTEYFPDALLAEVMVAVIGNEQHNPGEPLHWARDKSPDQMNTAFRHMWDHGRGITKDTDGQYHLAKAIWRLKAQLQLTIENEKQK